MLSPEDSEKVKAPEGTFKRLSLISEGILGNAYTKRLINIGLINGTPNYLFVSMRVDEHRGESYLAYSFKLTEGDEVIGIRANRGRWSPDNKPEMLNPPSIDQLLKEMHAAERNQRRLKAKTAP